MSAMTVRKTAIMATIALALTTPTWQGQAAAPAGDKAQAPWDIDASGFGGLDTGAVLTGGDAKPFDGFGHLRLAVATTSGQSVASNTLLSGFKLQRNGDDIVSATPVTLGGIGVERRLTMLPSGALRAYDLFINYTSAPLDVSVAWGGSIAPYVNEGAEMVVPARPAFVGVRANAAPAQPFVVAYLSDRKGAAVNGPSAHVFGTPDAPTFRRVTSMRSNPFAAEAPQGEAGHVGYHHTFRLEPGQSAALLTYLVKGAAEAAADSGKRLKAKGSEVRKIQQVAARLGAQPDLSGLSPRDIARIINWRLPSHGLNAKAPRGFSVVEANIAGMQRALAAGDVTSEELVRQYRARAAAYDRRGPMLHAFISANPQALDRARELDRLRAAGQLKGPLHGVPVAIKDSIDTADLPTTYGSKVFEGVKRPSDAFVVRRLHDAGAILLGKLNMDEFAWWDAGESGLGGITRNAYALDHRPGGSSSGSAVAVGANLAMGSLGTDTCESILGPAALANLVAMRPTHGLISMTGVLPIRPVVDVVGPMARSVADYAALLDVLAASDPEDPATASTASKRPPSYVEALDPARIKGARIGVLRGAFSGFPEQRENADAIEAALDKLRRLGAIVEDAPLPNVIAEVDKARANFDRGRYAPELTAYLEKNAGAPARSFDDILREAEKGRVLPRIADMFRYHAGRETTPETRAREAEALEGFRTLILETMHKGRYDALVYPTMRGRPTLIENNGFPIGNCSISAVSRLPQLTVPAGYYSREGFPVGLSLLGRPYDEPLLLSLGAAFEATTNWRRPPPAIP